VHQVGFPLHDCIDMHGQQNKKKCQRISERGKYWVSGGGNKRGMEYIL
jgi:hypothetical protein